jgi:hypothetical protein
MATQKLYALLIGINEYARPLIPNLKGTDKDVENMQQYLQDTYKGTFDLEIKVLQDEAAKRGDVIKELEQHLGKAEENDIALFFFAGHGSWQKTNEIFTESSAIEMEKTLVLHDSRTPKKQDLSEMELLVLLNYIGRNNSDIIVFIDACHRAGFESHTNQTIRLFEGINQPRKVEHYLYDTTVNSNKFYYFKQFLKYKKIKDFPSPKYVAFSACNETEYAEENENGGWFTQAVISSLTNKKDLQTYVQVYDGINSQIIDYSVAQTPVFKAHNKFDVNRIFISNETEIKKTKRFKVFKEGTKMDYSIQFGVQLGFPLDLEESISFNLFSETDELVGTGEVQSIGVRNSSIHLSLPSRNYEDSYWAEILNLNIKPLPIEFIGVQEDLDRLKEGLQHRDIEPIVFVTDAEVSRFRLTFQEATQSYRLYEKERSVFILEFDQSSINNADLLDVFIDNLEHLGEFQRTVELSNPKSEINTDDLVLTFNTPKIDENNAAQCVYFEKGVPVTTNLKSANEFPQKRYTKVLLDCEAEEKVDYGVGITNTSFSQDYYVACLLISGDYGVFPLASNIPLPARESLDNIIDLNYGTLLIGREDDTQITNYLKVIISRDKLPTTEGFMLRELALGQRLEDQIKSRAVGLERVKIFDWQALGLEFCLKKSNKV